jgi:hypothetical protein
MVMAIRPRRKVGRERALWLIPAIVWAIFQYTELGQQSGVGYLTPVGIDRLGPVGAGPASNLNTK